MPPTTGETERHSEEEDNAGSVPRSVWGPDATPGPSVDTIIPEQEPEPEPTEQKPSRHQPRHTERASQNWQAVDQLELSEVDWDAETAYALTDREEELKAYLDGLQKVPTQQRPDKIPKLPPDKIQIGNVWRYSRPLRGDHDEWTEKNFPIQQFEKIPELSSGRTQSDNAARPRHYAYIKWPEKNFPNTFAIERIFIQPSQDDRVNDVEVELLALDSLDHATERISLSSLLEDGVFVRERREPIKAVKEHAPPRPYWDPNTPLPIPEAAETTTPKPPERFRHISHLNLTELADKNPDLAAMLDELAARSAARWHASDEKPSSNQSNRITTLHAGQRWQLNQLHYGPRDRWYLNGLRLLDIAVPPDGDFDQVQVTLAEDPKSDQKDTHLSLAERQLHHIPLRNLLERGSFYRQESFRQPYMQKLKMPTEQSNLVTEFERDHQNSATEPIERIYRDSAAVLYIEFRTALGVFTYSVTPDGTTSVSRRLSDDQRDSLELIEERSQYQPTAEAANDTELAELQDLSDPDFISQVAERIFRYRGRCLADSTLTEFPTPAAGQEWWYDNSRVTVTGLERFKITLKNDHDEESTIPLLTFLCQAELPMPAVRPITIKSDPAKPPAKTVESAEPAPTSKTTESVPNAKFSLEPGKEEIASFRTADVIEPDNPLRAGLPETIHQGQSWRAKGTSGPNVLITHLAWPTLASDRNPASVQVQYGPPEQPDQYAHTLETFLTNIEPVPDSPTTTGASTEPQPNRLDYEDEKTRNHQLYNYRLGCFRSLRDATINIFQGMRNDEDITDNLTRIWPDYAPLMTDNTQTLTERLGNWQATSAINREEMAAYEKQLHETMSVLIKNHILCLVPKLHTVPDNLPELDIAEERQPTDNPALADTIFRLEGAGLKYKDEVLVKPKVMLYQATKPSSTSDTTPPEGEKPVQPPEATESQIDQPPAGQDAYQWLMRDGLKPSHSELHGAITELDPAVREVWHEFFQHTSTSQAVASGRLFRSLASGAVLLLSPDQPGQCWVIVPDEKQQNIEQRRLDGVAGSADFYPVEFLAPVGLSA